MISSLHNGVSALKSLTQGLQVLGNNIANVNSLGYKSARANYSDNFYLHLNDAESGAEEFQTTTCNSMVLGTCRFYLSDFNQGTIESLVWIDIAIQGGSSQWRRILKLLILPQQVFYKSRCIRRRC